MLSVRSNWDLHSSSCVSTINLAASFLIVAFDQVHASGHCSSDIYRCTAKAVLDKVNTIHKRNHKVFLNIKKGKKLKNRYVSYPHFMDWVFTISKEEDPPTSLDTCIVSLLCIYTIPNNTNDLTEIFFIQHNTRQEDYSTYIRTSA